MVCYVNPKYNEKTKLCYISSDSFIVHVKNEDIFEGITKDLEKGFETLNYELERPLLKRKKQTSYQLNER